MTTVLLLCALTGLVLAGLVLTSWAVHRHIELVAWNRELDAAFGNPDRSAPLTRSL